VLRIPVRYYRNPPGYFRGWRGDAPPRWGEHWGNDWERQRNGWDRWNRRAVPAAAPLPRYQQRYSGERYPQAEQQPSIQGQNYRYQPRDNVARQHYQEQGLPRASAPQQRPEQGGPAGQPHQRESTGQEQRQRPQQGQTKEREKGDERGQERNK
jgi:hypothetical protein